MRAPFLSPFFHQLIDCWMADNHLTNAVVAKRCGKSPSWVSRFRTGPRTFISPHDTITLAHALGMPVEWLLDEMGFELDPKTLAAYQRSKTIWEAA